MTRTGLIILIILLYVFDFTVLANIILISFVADIIITDLLTKKSVK